MSPEADLHFYFDPVCPFAWMTSKWVRMVAAQRDYRVDWRFISLRILNASIDYTTHFPEHYEDEHTAGKRLLRVCARVRSEVGRAAIPPLYQAMGERLFETPRDGFTAADLGTVQRVQPLLREAGLSDGFAAALDDAALDDEILAETEEALARHSDPALPAAGRDGLLRARYQQAAVGRRRRSALGSRHRACRLPRLRRAQAQPARAATAGKLRR